MLAMKKEVEQTTSVYQSTHSTLPTLLKHRRRMDEHTCMGLNIRLEQVMLITHFFLFMTMFHVQCVTLQHENDSTNNCCISQMVQCKPYILKSCWSAQLEDILIHFQCYHHWGDLGMWAQSVYVRSTMVCWVISHEFKLVQCFRTCLKYCTVGL